MEEQQKAYEVAIKYEQDVHRVVTVMANSKEDAIDKVEKKFKHYYDDFEIDSATEHQGVRYMGNIGDRVVIEESGTGEFKTVYLTNADTFNRVDMFFSDRENAEKYADKKGLIIVEKFAKGGSVAPGEWVVYDPKSGKEIKTCKNHRAALIYMNKLWREGEHEEIGMQSKETWEKFGSGGITRSTDASVRPSPSVSATIYPKDYMMEGNDGNMWKIIVDSRGVHRWQKAIGMSYVMVPSGIGRGLVQKPISTAITPLAPEPKEKTEKQKLIDFIRSIKTIDDLAKLATDFKQIDDPEKFVSVISYVAQEYDSLTPIDLLYDWEKQQTSKFGGWFEIGKEFYIEQNKDKSAFIEKIKKQIEGIKMLIEDDPSLREELEMKVRQKIEAFELASGNVANQAAELYREYLRESFKAGGIINKAKKKAEIYARAAGKTVSKIGRDILLSFKK